MTATSGPSILIVDDDPHIREVVRFALGREGYRTLEASTGVDALAAFDRGNVDLVILDILMPEMDGTDVCRALRARSCVPLIFLTSKDDEIDRIVGLELGGDDYVTKPFSPRELVARVRAVLRRSAPAEGSAAPARRTEGRGRPDTAEDARARAAAGAATSYAPSDSSLDAAGPGLAGRRLRHGLLEVDLDRCQVFWDRREITVTATELGLLRTLATRPGRVYSRDEIMRLAYEQETHVSGRTIDSHVRRLRAKFAEEGGDPILTVHGIGYKLGPCE